MNNKSIATITMNQEPLSASFSVLDFVDSPRRIDTSRRQGPDKSFTVKRNNQATFLRNSMSRLQFSPMKQQRKSSPGWGHESLKLSLSLWHDDNTKKDDDDSAPEKSGDDYKSAQTKLLEQVKDAIQTQAKRKKFLQQVVDANMEMAKARYTSGSQMGAILSMRKVFKDKSAAAYAAAARVRLKALQSELLELDDSSYANNNNKPSQLVKVGMSSPQQQWPDVCDANWQKLAQQRQVLHTILGDLTTATYGPVPDNEALLQELQTFLED